MILCFFVGGISEYYLKWWTYLEDNIFYPIEKVIIKKK